MVEIARGREQSAVRGEDGGVPGLVGFEVKELFPGGHFDDPGFAPARAVRAEAAGNEAPAIRGESQRAPQVRWRAAQAADFLSCRHVPSVYAAAASHCRQKFVVRGEQDTDDSA